MPRPRVLRSTTARLSIRPAIGGLRQCWRCVVICNGVSPIRSSALGSQLPAERLVPVVSNRIKLCQRADEPQDAARQGNGEVHVYLSIPLSACAPLKTTWHGWPTPATRRAGQELGGPSSACRLPARTQRNANSMPVESFFFEKWEGSTAPHRRFAMSSIQDGWSPFIPWGRLETPAAIGLPAMSRPRC